MSQSKQIPSVCRMVHYQSYGSPGGEFKSVPRAAVITEVHDAEAGDVTLFVMNPSGVYFNRVQYDESGKPGTWRWPNYAPHVPNHKLAELERIAALEALAVEHETKLQDKPRIAARVFALESLAVEHETKLQDKP